MSTQESGTTPSTLLSRSGNPIYRTVWRWHFYAGLWVVPFMMILAITGIIYLFKPQLDPLMYRHQMLVQSTGSPITYAQQIGSVNRAYPGSTLSKITPPIASHRSTEVELTTSDSQLITVFVNPYSGEVLGERDETYNLQAIARKIHGELMIGKVGDYLIELAACWGLVLLISGLFLWWPRQPFSVWGTVLPRLKSENPRLFWRDLHSVSGFYGAALVGFLILTGLPWAGFWGDQFSKVWNHYPPQLWNEVPHSTVLTGSLNHGSNTVPWAAEQLPMPHSGDHVHPPSPQSSDLPAYRDGIRVSTPVTLDSVITFAQTQGAPPGFTVTPPDGESGVYTVAAFTGDVAKEMTLHIDQYSGEVLAAIRWNDYGWVPKVVEWGIAVHMGLLFGVANQIVMLLACLIVIILCVSGIVMWWKRRPQGRLGAPALPRPEWKVPLVVTAILGVAFPLVGISLVAVLALDYLVLSRIPALKRIFG